MTTFDYIHSHPDEVVSILLVLAWGCLLPRTRSLRGNLSLLSIIGTIGHEGMHAVFGWILGAKPTRFRILTEGHVLGSVGFANLNIWNAAPVAFAPLALSALGYWTFYHWMLPVYAENEFVIWLAAGYVTASCIFSGLPSPTDIKVGALSAFMYGALVLVASVAMRCA